MELLNIGIDDKTWNRDFVNMLLMFKKSPIVSFASKSQKEALSSQGSQDIHWVA